MSMYADPADTLAERFYAEWAEDFEAKLLEHVRSDHRMQVELRAEWEQGSQPGACAAYYLELIAYGRARLQAEAKLAHEYYGAATWQDREDFARANGDDPR